MRKNPLRYLSLLSLLGILGFITDNAGFYGFFGFLGYLGFGRIIPDERFKDNVNKAAKNAFLTSMLIFPFATIAGAITHNPMIYAFAFAINFGVQVLIFGISLSYYEK